MPYYDDKKEIKGINANQAMFSIVSVILLIVALVNPKWLEIESASAGLSFVTPTCSGTNQIRHTITTAKFCKNHVLQCNKTTTVAQEDVDIIVAVFCDGSLHDQMITLITFSIICGVLSSSACVYWIFSSESLFSFVANVPFLMAFLEGFIGLFAVVLWFEEVQGELRFKGTCPYILVSGCSLAILTSLSLGVTRLWPGLCDVSQYRNFNKKPPGLLHRTFQVHHNRSESDNSQSFIL